MSRAGYPPPSTSSERQARNSWTYRPTSSAECATDTVLHATGDGLDDRRRRVGAGAAHVADIRVEVGVPVDIGEIRRSQLDAVAFEESDHHHQRNSLVAVEVWVVPGQAEGVGSSQIGKACFALVAPAVPGTSERRFERVLIAQAMGTAVLPDLPIVRLVDREAPEPARLGAKWLSHLDRRHTIPARLGLQSRTSGCATRRPFTDGRGRGRGEGESAGRLGRLGRLGQ